jgi:hypothetical protein
MALGSDFDKLCPLFDCVNSTGGVIFPYRVPAAQSGHEGFDLSTASVDMIFRFPFPVRLITCIGYAVSDDQGLKTGAATTEPIIGISYAASAAATFNSAGDGTEISTMTCDLTGDIGSYWVGTTTATNIEAMAPIAAYVKTAAATDSGIIDGAAVVDLWFAVLNAP